MLIPILTLSLFFGSVNTAHAVSALDFARTAVWYIIKYAANTFYTKQPTISSGYNWVQSSTGSFKFNNNTYGASTKVTTKLPDSSMSIAVWANTSAVNVGQKLSVILTNKNGNDVINKSISSGQIATFSPSSAFGNYTLRFVENDKITWNCFYKITDHDKQIPPGYQSITPSTMMNLSGKSNNDIEFIEDNDGFCHLLARNNYYAPSNHPLTMIELQQQFYNPDLEMDVEDLASYSSGDIIVFEDEIKDIEYCSKTNTTSLTFNGLSDDIIWKFKGDISSKYTCGDLISLSFKVINTFQYNTYSFESLDYLQEFKLADDENKLPNISDYIIND